MTVYGLQYDTTGLLNFIPDLQAFYFNGPFARRPYITGRGRVWIDVTGDAPLDCHWLDLEKGDANPGRAPTWLCERRHGVEDTGGVYCARAALPDILKAIQGLPCNLWLATLDGTADPAAIPELADLPPNVRLVAIQAYPAAWLGVHADLSVIVDQAYWDKRHA